MSAESNGDGIVAPLPKNELLRLKALQEYAVMDSTAEQAYDDIVRLAAFICKTPMAYVGFIDSDRQWFKAKVGLEASQVPRETTFCNHAILKPSEVMVIPDASRDVRFATHPAVTADQGVRFYVGVPLVTPTGEALGTLCAVDYTPRQLEPEQIEIMRILSRQVIAQLELRRSIAVLESGITEREQYVEQLVQHQQTLEVAQVQLEIQSVTDSLTGVKNRRAFNISLDEEFARAQRQHSPLSLVMLDVDWFKHFNDSFGHPAGDEALRAVAKIMQQNVRPYDVVARYGGEEFAAILPATGREGALVIAERCRRAIQSAVWPHRAVTASLGVATLSADMVSSLDLLTKADKALYQSKQGGRNRISCV